jgi:hypothetical protein
MKHVCVTIDSREKTSSRKNEAVDLLTLWNSSSHNSASLGGQIFQVATAALNMGDVWISASNTPIVIPLLNQVAPPPPSTYPSSSTYTSTSTSGKEKGKEPLHSLEKSKLSAPSMNFFSIPNDDIMRKNNTHQFVDLTMSDDDYEGEDPSIVGDGDEDPPIMGKNNEVIFPLAPKIVIERKSLADLENSYGDGRYREQKMRLINCEAEMVILLVEGYDGGKIKDESRKKKFLSTFVHSMFRDGIYVYHTRNIQESFEWIMWIANEMALGKLERTQEYMARTKYTDNIQMNKKANLTPERGLEMQLACIPGISAKMARAVTEKYNSMFELCDAYRALPNEKARQLLLADLSFRGSSGKSQRLATRSAKIYSYLKGEGARGAPSNPLTPNVTGTATSKLEEPHKKKRAKVTDNKIVFL